MQDIDRVETSKEEDDSVDEDITPEKFNLEEYLSILKTHRNKRQSQGRERYVLFVLENSGSIGKSEFNDVKAATADLVPLLCDAKVAVMTYSTNVYCEICYNCNQGSQTALRQAILSIQYRGGLTASGDTIRCACDYMLNSPCKFNRNIYNPLAVDVIFLTDGRSNRGEDVCKATKCLDTISNVNVFPIAVGNNINWNELNCTRGSNGNPNDILNLRDLNDLIILIKASSTKLINNPSYCIK